MRIGRTLLVCGLVCALGATGCASGSKRARRGGCLPFVVRLSTVEIAVEQPGEAAGDESGLAGVAIPPRFADRARVTESIASSLRKTRLFTDVVTNDAPAADLILDIHIRGSDFGSGDALVIPSMLSTLTWLFVGHFSWWINDREYTRSDVVMDVAIRRARTSAADRAGRSVVSGDGGTIDVDVGSGGSDKAAAPLFEHELLIRGLRLGLIDRAGMADWFLSMVRPPWWGDGDVDRTGRSLATKAVESFADAEVPQIMSRFPERFHSWGGFLVDDVAKNRLIIASERALTGLRISCAGRRSARVLDRDRLIATELWGRERDAARLALSRQDVDLGNTGGDRFYVVELQSEDEGLVRLEATLGTTSPVTATWTVYREPRKTSAGVEVTDESDAATFRRAAG